MHKKNYNWFYGLLASLLTLALLFGGQMVFNKYAMARPMDKMFEQLEGVESFDANFTGESKSGSRTKLHVKLNNVKNLQVLYTQIISGLDRYGGAKKYDIILDDYRNPKLEEFYYQIHYYLEEAMITGKFVEMAGEIRKTAKARQIDAKVYIDADYIYLQMTESEEFKDQPEPAAQMYVVIPRRHAVGSQEAR